jgi:hypothetical protein
MADALALQRINRFIALAIYKKKGARLSCALCKHDKKSIKF